MWRKISTKNKDFQAVLRQKQPDTNLAMIKWMNTVTVQRTDIEPIWKNFFLVVRLINLDHLAEQINTYLSGGVVKQLPEGASASIGQDPGSQKTTEGMAINENFFHCIHKKKQMLKNWCNVYTS